MPVIGFLNTQSPDGQLDRLGAFRLGLKESGYIEGENVAIHYRWAEDPFDPADRTSRGIGSPPCRCDCHGRGNLAALAAKEATSTTPIVFITNEDPVRLGLVTNSCAARRKPDRRQYFYWRIDGKAIEFAA